MEVLVALESNDLVNPRTLRQIGMPTTVVTKKKRHLRLMMMMIRSKWEHNVEPSGPSSMGCEKEVGPSHVAPPMPLRGSIDFSPQRM